MTEEGVKRCLNGGFKAWELKLGPSISMLKVGWQGWLGVVGFDGDVIRLSGTGSGREG
jgi:hypothetical protein